MPMPAEFDSSRDELETVHDENPPDAQAGILDAGASHLGNSNRLI
jgi:hypothetical protein